MTDLWILYTIYCIYTVYILYTVFIQYIYYILEYRSVQASERTPVHKYTSTQNGDRSVQAGERKPRPGLNVASFEGGYPYGSPSHFSQFGK